MTLVSRKLLRREEGYEVWRELSRVEFGAEVISAGDDPEATEALAEEISSHSNLVTVDTCYGLHDGPYIGDEKTTTFLIGKGIKPELAPGRKVCSIGFCERERKWYGWSHRAIYGFAVGDIAEEGDCVCSSGWTDEYLADHPEEDLRLPVGFKAETLEDAKRMAVAFAESVG